MSQDDPASTSRTPATMRAWVVAEPGRLEPVELPVPEPGPGEVLVRVEACGVCRTDLHVRDGDLPPHRSPVVPGHEIVGTVVATGGPGLAPPASSESGHTASTDSRTPAGSSPPSESESRTPRGSAEFALGTRIGVPWLRHTCGVCHYCRSGAENLCPESRYTGWDADGGYAEYAVAPSSYAYVLPPGYTADELAPLLCAGIIGYRAWKRAEPARPVDPAARDTREGERLGIYGFGASAHLTLQVALAHGQTVHVLTRSEAAQHLALELGADSAAGAYDLPPEPLDSAILFAPVGDLVPTALRALDRGGALAVAGIYLSAIPPLDYEETLFYERDLRSVTSNTRVDGVEFLRFAAERHLDLTVTRYPFDRADEALDDLAADRVTGVAVLTR